MSDTTIRTQGKFELVRHVKRARSKHGFDIVQYIIFKRGACAMEEVKRFYGEAAASRAQDEFDKLAGNVAA